MKFYAKCGNILSKLEYTGVFCMAEKYLVEGYEFDTLEEATIAKKEIQAVKYLSQKTSRTTPQEVYKIYNKIVEDDLFKTEIGLDYLRALEEYLMQSGLFEVKEEAQPEVSPFDVSTEEAESVSQEVFEPDVSEAKATDSSKSDKKKKEKKPKEKKLKSDVPLDGQVKVMKDKLTFSLILNAVLIIAVLAMMYIASTSSNVNILNYETAIQDKYSSWAEELKTKETQIKEREKAVTEAEKKVSSLKKQIGELEEQLSGLQDEAAQKADKDAMPAN